MKSLEASEEGPSTPVTLVPDGPPTPRFSSTSLPNSRTASLSNLDQPPKTPYAENQFTKVSRHGPAVSPSPINTTKRRRMVSDELGVDGVLESPSVRAKRRK